MRVKFPAILFVAIVAIPSASIVVLANAPGVVAPLWRLALSLPIPFIIYFLKPILSKLYPF